MYRNRFAFALAATVLSANITSSAAQTASGTAVQPTRLAQGESGGAATSGGVASGGATAETPAPAPPPASPELSRGPPAGEDRAMFLSTDTLIVGGTVAAAVIVCAITCFGNSTSTTTSTTVHK